MTVVLIILAILLILLFFLTFIDKDKKISYRIKKAGIAILVFFASLILFFGAGYGIMSQITITADEIADIIGWIIAGAIIAGFIIALTLTQRIVK